MSDPSHPPFAAVFLDRDGVINEEDGIIREAGQLRLIEGSGAAIRQLNLLGLPVVVITNQPVVARGWASEEEVDRIHDRLREMLAAEDAAVDAIYFCPHHENADDLNYRVVCDCRKPRPGLLLRAAADLHLDLERCVMVGDRTVDLQAAREANCGAALLVKTGFEGDDGKCDVVPDATFADLADAVAYLESCQSQP